MSNPKKNSTAGKPKSDENEKAPRKIAGTALTLKNAKHLESGGTLALAKDGNLMRVPAASKMAAPGNTGRVPQFSFGEGKMPARQAPGTRYPIYNPDGSIAGYMNPADLNGHGSTEPRHVPTGGGHGANVPAPYHPTQTIVGPRKLPKKHQSVVRNAFEMAKQEAVTRGKAAALAFMYPSMLPGTRTPVSTLSPGAKTVAIPTCRKFPIVDFNGTTAHFGLVAVSPAWKSKYVVGSAITGDAFTSFTTTDEAAMSEVGALFEGIVQGPMCVRLANSTTAISMGGTLVCGLVPIRLIVSGITFATLQGYPGMQECNWPEACDMTHPWIPQSTNNDTPFVGPTTAAAAGNYAVVFCYRSTQQQTVDVIVESTVNALPLVSAQNYFGAVDYPIDTGAFADALVAVEPHTKAMPTEEVSSNFWDAAKSLGSDVLRYIKNHGLAAVVEAGITTASAFLLDDTHVERFLRQYECTDVEAVLRGIESNKEFFPPGFQKAVEDLAQFRVMIARDALHWKNLRTDEITTFEEVTEIVDVFANKTSTRIKKTLRRGATEEESKLDSPRIREGRYTEIGFESPRYPPLPPRSAIRISAPDVISESGSEPVVVEKRRR